jgi:hypothetical protein
MNIKIPLHGILDGVPFSSLAGTLFRMAGSPAISPLSFCNNRCHDRAPDRYENPPLVTIIDTELHDTPGLQPEINGKASNGAEKPTVGNTIGCY